MKNINETVWVVEEGYDRSYTTVAYFINEYDALRLKEKSVYYSVFKKQINYKIFESYQEYAERVDIEIKKREALAKLTDEERKLLGV